MFSVIDDEIFNDGNNFVKYFARSHFRLLIFENIGHSRLPLPHQKTYLVKNQLGMNKNILAMLNST